MDSEKPVLYLNISVLDPSEAVKHKVGKQIDKSNLPPPLKKFASKAAPKIASDLVTATVVAKQMSGKLCEKIPRKMQEKGMTVIVEPVFQEGPYVVLQLQVHHIDTFKLACPPEIEKHKDLSTMEAVELAPITPSTAWADFRCAWNANDPKRKAKFMVFVWALVFWIIGSSRRKKLEELYFPMLVQSKMDSVMTEMLEQKMEKKKMDAEAIVLSEQKQARYFYAQLQRVRQVETERKARGPAPARRLKDKLSNLTRTTSGNDDQPSPDLEPEEAHESKKDS